MLFPYSGVRLRDTWTTLLKAPTPNSFDITTYQRTGDETFCYEVATSSLYQLMRLERYSSSTHVKDTSGGASLCWVSNKEPAVHSFPTKVKVHVRVVGLGKRSHLSWGYDQRTFDRIEHPLSSFHAPVQQHGAATGVL